MNCKESQKLFSACFEEELSVAEEKELRDHLETCARCARDYRDFEATVTCVRRMPKEVASPEMTNMIMRRVRQYEPRSAWSFFAPRMRIAAALAAMLLVGSWSSTVALSYNTCMVLPSRMWSASPEGAKGVTR